jgi:hypothetical protein
MRKQPLETYTSPSCPALNHGSTRCLSLYDVPARLLIPCVSISKRQPSMRPIYLFVQAATVFGIRPMQPRKVRPSGECRAGRSTAVQIRLEASSATLISRRRICCTRQRCGIGHPVYARPLQICTSRLRNNFAAIAMVLPLAPSLPVRVPPMARACGRRRIQRLQIEYKE